MDIVSLIIQLASGAIGGNLAGSLLKKLSLGLLGNSLAGIVGGALGGQILERAIGLAPTIATGAGAGAPDVGAVVSQIAGGGVGGAVMMVIVGLLRSAFAK
jgi:hypothetical protein